MNKPVRIQLSRRKGWRMPENTVKVDRSTRWGNPFAVSPKVSADLAIEMFRDLLTGYFDPYCLKHLTDDEFNFVYEQKTRFERRLNYGTDISSAAKAELRGKNLACWCPLEGQPCHADVLLDLANR